MSSYRCQCVGSAREFHESVSKEHCKYLNACYTFQRSKDSQSRCRMYQFLRCLGHDEDEALHTAILYHETDLNGNFRVAKMSFMQCFFVHFRSGDIVINGDDVSLSRLTCWNRKQIKNKLFKKIIHINDTIIIYVQ